MKEDCIFCKIVNGEIPCHKVYEDENILAFLDSDPEMDGHTLIIPKEHVNDVFESNREVLEKVIEGSHQVALLMKKNFEVDGVNVFNNSGKYAGQIINHLHFHIIPRYEGDGRKLDIVGEKKINKDFEEILKKIKGEENESE